eukprot:scaffold764_cov248-Pinguiococcus_pyrenoidosus.AAC.34
MPTPKSVRGAAASGSYADLVPKMEASASGGPPAAKEGAVKSSDRKPLLKWQRPAWDAWRNAPRFGSVAAGSRFLALKAPLDPVYETKTENKPFPLDLLMDATIDRQERVVALVNASKQDGYIFDEKVLPDWDLEYLALPVDAEAEPESKGLWDPMLSVDDLNRFCGFAERVLGADDDEAACIGVFDSHGFNNAGALIVYYMATRLRVPLGTAIIAFADSRRPGIYSTHHLEMLVTILSGKPTLRTPPPPPKWDTRAAALPENAPVQSEWSVTAEEHRKRDPGTPAAAAVTMGAPPAAGKPQQKKRAVPPPPAFQTSSSAAQQRSLKRPRIALVQGGGEEEAAAAAAASEEKGQDETGNAAATAAAPAAAATSAAKPRAQTRPPSNIPPRLAQAVYPPDWIVAFSRSQKRCYFFNTKTKTSVWEPPDGTQFPTESKAD